MSMFSDSVFLSFPPMHVHACVHVCTRVYVCACVCTCVRDTQWHIIRMNNTRYTHRIKSSSTLKSCFWRLLKNPEKPHMTDTSHTAILVVHMCFVKTVRLYDTHALTKYICRLLLHRKRSTMWKHIRLLNWSTMDGGLQDSFLPGILFSSLLWTLIVMTKCYF